MNDDVQRYMICGGGAHEAPGGTWVRADDYDRLRAEVERLKSREISDKQIDAAWSGRPPNCDFEEGFLAGLASVGIVECPECGGTNRYIDPHLNYQECECPSCSNNGWIREERGDE